MEKINYKLQENIPDKIGGNKKTKARWKSAVLHRQQDLSALQNWEKFKTYEKNKLEKIKAYNNPNKDKVEDMILIFSIKKGFIEKLARFHYLMVFMFVALIDYIFLSLTNFDFENLFLIIPLSVLTIISGLFLISNYICSLRIFTHIEGLATNKYVVLRMGEPGTGKSSSGIYDAIEIAIKLWNALKFAYWKIKNRIQKIYSGTHLEHKVIGLDKNKKPIVEYKRVYTGNEDKIKHTVEIVEAYEYYSENDVIPCFWSNIPIFKDGKPATIFTAEHLLQKEKVVYKGIAFLDEIGSMLPPELSNNKIEPIDQMFRFTRQHKDFRLMNTEQDGKATLISARRVTAENKRMLEQKHIFKPPILNWILKIAEDKIQEKEPTERRVRFISNFRKYVDSVGFRKFKYEDYTNLEVGDKGGVSSKKKAFIAPPHLNCFYDDRTFKNLYIPKNEASNPKHFTKPVLSEEELKFLFNSAILDRVYKKKNQSKR